MNEYDFYVNIIKSIIKSNIKYEILISKFLYEICVEYYDNRNSKKYNLDNLYKKYRPLLYLSLKQKYIIANKDDLISKNNI